MHRTRRGILTTAVAAVIGLVVLSSNVFTAILAFVVSWLILWFVFWLWERRWEARTWPLTPSFARHNPRLLGAPMLREDPNAGILVDRGGFLWKKRYFFVATGLPPLRVSAAFFDGLAQSRHPPRLSQSHSSETASERGGGLRASTTGTTRTTARKTSSPSSVTASVGNDGS
jgi:hypothetical protein